ncbi:putative ribosomal protein L18e/L15P [Abeliophyllum distichum]|uniref:Ribosomal protein L18e/L15P n=1 Tax=Abeliophyllum distichum TaxID=126358 RepID=A0ABD1RDJ4_9LAMI
MVSSSTLDLDIDLEKEKALQSNSLNFSSKYNIVLYMNPSAALDLVNDTTVEATGGSRVNFRTKATVEVGGGSVRRMYYNKVLKPEWFEKKGRLLRKVELEKNLRSNFVAPDEVCGSHLQASADIVKAVIVKAC